MFQGLILLLSRLLWLQPRTGLIFESSNKDLEPGAAWMCLGCYSIPSLLGGGNMGPSLLRRRKALGGKKSLWKVGLPDSFVHFLRVVPCQARSVSIFHVKHTLFAHCF